MTTKLMLSMSPQNIVDLFDKPTLFIGSDYRILASNTAYGDHFQPPTKHGFCYEQSHEFSSPCNTKGEDCPLEQVLKTGKSAKALHIHYRAGTRHFCRVQLTPVFTKSKTLMGFLEVLEESQAASPDPSEKHLVGESPTFKAMMESVHRVAPTNVSVLLEGESGTGKELIAKAIHDASHRASARFVVLECSGINENLFESELFGYRKGAFTGARSDHEGLAATASGGTLFLDEVGDIPINLQVKLLRLLETGTFRPVGANDMNTTDFRLICASHKNLKQMVVDGSFREDLYFRLATFPIPLPPLRDRISDLPGLCETLLSRPPVPENTYVSNAALRQLSRYRFPGNIRELRNILIRASLLADDHVIQTKHLPAEISQKTPRHLATKFADEIYPLAEMEAQYMEHVSHNFSGSPMELALKLGISERTLYRKLAKIKGR